VWVVSFDVDLVGFRFEDVAGPMAGRQIIDLAFDPVDLGPGIEHVCDAVAVLAELSGDEATVTINAYFDVRRLGAVLGGDLRHPYNPQRGPQDVRRGRWSAKRAPFAGIVRIR
jgi:hypothetical protein